MFKLFILLCILFQTSNVLSENASFDESSRLVVIPFVEVNNIKAYQDVKLKIRYDGLFELVDYTNLLSEISTETESSTSVSPESFKISIASTSYTSISPAWTYKGIPVLVTDEGYLVEIVETEGFSVSGTEFTFTKVPDDFPDGYKDGDYYYSKSVFANILAENQGNIQFKVDEDFMEAYDIYQTTDGLWVVVERGYVNDYRGNLDGYNFYLVTDKIRETFNRNDGKYYATDSRGSIVFVNFYSN